MKNANCQQSLGVWTDHGFEFELNSYAYDWKEKNLRSDGCSPITEKNRLARENL